MIINICTCLNLCMFDWSGEMKISQGILISCVSGNTNNLNVEFAAI